MAKDQFTALIDKLPLLLDKLKNSPLRNRLGKYPFEKGIYVFYENKKPIYVGRTDRMKGRIQEHGRPGSKHNDASFAYLLARKEINKNENLSRDEFCEKYEATFTKQKEQVGNMSFRCVEVDDCITQALLEIYISISLKTYHNDFCNH